MKAIAAAFPDRDIGDPGEVAGREIGNAAKLTKQEMFDIEDQATDFGRRRKWGKPGKDYRFSFRTITCCDSPDQEVKRDRRDRSNRRTAAKRKSKRLESAMETMQLPTKTRYASLRDAVTANVRAQGDALHDAIEDDGSTIANLMARVRSDPSWRALAGKPDSFRRIVSLRLDALRDAGRIADDYAPGLRGRGLVRVVRRA
jgi:hypothetical protein